ncbi:MAG: MotA/TolQ/ExbB proton channel family protein [Desulfovibrio sp.]|jgi:biopolymer transport protein ExbB|nr:MotA/TolQ/ExbB proton channel family protein [Desulfovibrio sp.]
MWTLFLAGGPVMWPLLLCSLLALTVIIERACFWLRLDMAGDEANIERLLDAYYRGDDWRKLAERERSPGHGIVRRMLLSGMAHDGFSSVKAMEAVAQQAVRAMRRGMGVLDTIITVAPMLGILGTVLGIISSFDMLGQAGINEPQAVVAGIAEALITTAAGLIISIATVFPFNYFNSRIENARDVLEHYGTRLEMAQGKMRPAQEGETTRPAQEGER